MARKKINLLFSDTEVGHPDFGFIPRKHADDPDREDSAYRKHLMKKHPSLHTKNVNVVDGAVWLDE